MNGVLSGAARTILDACQSAWVFGGMGTWNDLAFPDEDQKLYLRASDALFRAIIDAIVAAVGDNVLSRGAPAGA